MALRWCNLFGCSRQSSSNRPKHVWMQSPEQQAAASRNSASEITKRRRQSAQLQQEGASNLLEVLHTFLKHPSGVQYHLLCELHIMGSCNYLGNSRDSNALLVYARVHLAHAPVPLGSCSCMHLLCSG
jgi:hypothetical protein